jgi:hypothetical protein
MKLAALLDLLGQLRDDVGTSGGGGRDERRGNDLRAETHDLSARHLVDSGIREHPKMSTLWNTWLIRT